MPIRSRSHELEDESFKEFYGALPAKWVPRKKDRDYGIDCEVEVFDPSGPSTGLTFLVQLRATDDRTRAQSVRIETDELAYYRQQELPVMVVRYCSSEKSLHWQWATTIAARVKIAEEQNSFTYNFRDEERWNHQTPGAIRQTLDVRRALAAYPADAAIRLRFDTSQIPHADRYRLERLLNDAIRESGGALVRAREDRQLVEVAVTVSPGRLALRIDTLTSVTFDLPDADTAIIASSVLYGLVKLLDYNRLPRQAEAVARLLARLGYTHPNAGLALTACYAIGSDLPSMAQLAILNGFHHQSDVNHSLIAVRIGLSSQRADLRRQALNMFFGAALDAAALVGPANQAAAHYSIGNFYRQHDTPARTLHHYNRARRLRPAYLETAYFLGELGGVLYRAARFSAAARAYAAAHMLDRTPHSAFVLGDALLMSGLIADAEAHFADTSERGPQGRLAQEAELKAICCRRLMAQLNTGVIPTCRAEADLLQDPLGADPPQILEQILASVDGLNPRARFNLGWHQSRAGDNASAWFNFLLCAFVQPNDVSAWANAALCCFPAEPDLVLAILTVGMHDAGPEVYDKLRADLVSQNASTDAIEAMDYVAAEIVANQSEESAREFTVRMLNGDRFDEMTITEGTA